MLLTVLQRLVSLGNTVVVVEHNLDLIQAADWIIDLGLEGGEGGGQVIASGTPEDVVKKQAILYCAVSCKVFRTQNSKVLQLKRKPAKKKANVKKENTPSPTVLETIKVQDAHMHNLKAVDIEIPRDKMSVFCGHSGSGKTTLAMDTIYAEGQRRYVESLSSYARQFVGQMAKPMVGSISGLSPAVCFGAEKPGAHSSQYRRNGY